MSTYLVKEVFYSLQGEGLQSGRPAIFVRFIGCNLWSGQEADRGKAETICHFCDTDFRSPPKSSGGKFSSAATLAAHILSFWPESTVSPYIVFTGGEPLLQLDAELCHTLHSAGAILAIETNGTIATDLPLDWITVSPKSGTTLKQTSGSELKLVFPQVDLNPDDYSSLAFDIFFLQPCFSDTYQDNLAQAIAYCQNHPQWRLSLQSHKLIGVE